MKYKINYGYGVSVFPSDALKILDRAKEYDLKVLLCVCAAGGIFEIKDIAVRIGCGEDDVNASLAFWRGAGIFEIGAEEPSVSQTAFEVKNPDDKIKFTESADRGTNVNGKPKEKQAENIGNGFQESKKLAKSDALPNYTSDELSEILETRADAAMLINECQKIMGKIVNVHEINKIIGLSDYLALDSEYILLLVKYCAESGRKTLHYVEKTAFSLYDIGITGVDELSEELHRRDALKSAEGRIRSIFGIGSRALTARENKEISSWVNDFRYDFDIIQKAYEVTVDATGKSTVHYANSVLERWYSEGYRTLEQINESYKDKGKKESAAKGSFDTDEFFEAAVKRSFEGQ